MEKRIPKTIVKARFFRCQFKLVAGITVGEFAFVGAGAVINRYCAANYGRRAGKANCLMSAAGAT